MRRRRRNACLASLEHIRSACGELPLTDVVSFFYICENEGINLRELAQLAGISNSAASRCAQRLMGSDAALIEITRQERDGRGRTLGLTPRGALLRLQLNNIVLDATPILAD